MMCKKRARRRIALKLLETCMDWAIHYKLKIVISYSRTYHDFTADAMARNKVGQIEEWADALDFTWIGLPEIWYIFCTTAKSDDMSRTTPP